MNNNKIPLKKLCIEDDWGKYGIPASAEDFDDLKTRYLRITDISEDGELLNNDKRSVSASDLDKYILKEGDIVFARTGNSTGKSYYHEDKNGKLAFAGFLIKYALDNKKVNPKYLKYYTISNEYKNWVKNLSVGSTRGNINAQTFGDCPISIPNRKQQDLLVNTLSLLIDKIELNNHINAELEAMAKTLYDYWFVQFDFPNAKGKPYKSSGGKMIWNEGLKREIPDGWEVKCLGNLGNFKNGVNYDPSNPGEIACPIINVRNISASSYFLKNEDLDVIYLRESDVRKYAVHDGSIIIARSGIPGATRLISDIAENTLFCGFAIHYELQNLDYKIPIFFYLKSIEQQIQNGSGGTILKNVNQGTLNALQIALPKDNLVILKFNELIQPIFSKINLIQKENQQLAELRDWLLPMLMNGQVKVSDIEEKEELQMAAEPSVKYDKKPIEKEENAFLKRKVLASYIINHSLNDNYFGNVKFEKLLHLADYHAVQRDLGQKYLQQAAGPYDNTFTYAFFTQVEKAKWFKRQNLGNLKKIVAAENHYKSTNTYNYFSDEELKKVDDLISKFKNCNYEQPEIVSTLYAVWNNRIIKEELINDELLKQDFLQWDNQKTKYKDRLDEALQWMRKEDLIPQGWGPIIEKSKRK